MVYRYRGPRRLDNIYKREQYPNNWSAVSKTARAKTNNHCSRCHVKGTRDNPIEAHHILSLSPHNSVPINLKPLCRRCHKLLHHNK